MAAAARQAARPVVNRFMRMDPGGLSLQSVSMARKRRATYGSRWRVIGRSIAQSARRSVPGQQSVRGGSPLEDDSVAHAYDAVARLRDVGAVRDQDKRETTLRT